MDMDSLLIPPSICTANDWNIEYGIACGDTEDFFSASRWNYGNDVDIDIIACNTWEDPITDIFDWPETDRVGNMYLEIEKEMVPLFAHELEQLGEDTSAEAMRQFFNGRYSAGVDYISVIHYRDDIKINIVIYISDPHEFIREMKRLQGAPAFQYSAADMLEFLSAGESRG